MHNIETIDKLLIDELSATETYHQAIDKLHNAAGQGELAYLTPIYEDHKVAAASLQAQIRQLEGIPPENTGAFGTWAKMVLRGANLLGKKAVLKALQVGEKSGEENYKEALQHIELPLDIRALIETKLLPAQQTHIVILEQLLDDNTA